MTEFRAYRVYNDGGTVQGRLERTTLDKLSPGEVVIRAEYSSVNYKDALAATGAGKIIRSFPRIAGIDVAGHVLQSTDKRYPEGMPVLVTGYDFGVDHDGGYSGQVRVPAEWVVPIPEGMTTFQAMAIGTAGFTAALCVQRMEDNNQTPALGPILITGASGGVGMLAIDIYAKLGYQVIALSGKLDRTDELKVLGATQVMDRKAVKLDGPPLEKGQWGGAVDNVGGDILAWLTRTVVPWGNIASVGLAGGSQLNTTVMPFILRGVSLLGITSSGCPTELRHRLWKRLATDLAPRHLDKIVSRVAGLEELPDIFTAMLAGKTTGRTVVRISDES